MENGKSKFGYTLQIYYLAALTFILPVNMLLIAIMPLIAAVIFIILYFSIVMIIGCLNILKSFKSAADGRTGYCINSMLILKYGLVVFFLLNFLMFAFISFIALVASRGTIIFAFPITIPFFVIAFLLSWVMLIPGAFYGVQAARISYDAGKIGFGEMILHCILQFCFVADVFDAMYLSVVKWGMGKKSSAAIAILSFFMAGGIIFLFAKIFAF